MSAAAHLAAMLERHRRWCRDQGEAVPADVVTLVEALISVRRGQDESSGRSALDVGDDPGVSLLVDYHEAARLLDVSVSTVQRLVAAGELRAIAVGAAKRLPRDELARFVSARLEECK